MKFDDLDSQMRVFETMHDQFVLPEIYMVARLDGRGFTRLTKEVHRFEAPFDTRFRDLMLDTTEALVAEFNALYGYTQSDEISLLFPLNCDLFQRKLRKLNSVLAGFASAKFALGLGSMACMDCRICQLPNARRVVDYFRWRSEDAHRNALSAHCYWLLRKAGENGEAAAQRLLGLSTADKNELLFQQGVNFNDLPSWMKRGTGVYWETYNKQGINPKTGNVEMATRRRIVRNMELPLKDTYAAFIENFLSESIRVVAKAPNPA